MRAPSRSKRASFAIAHEMIDERTAGPNRPVLLLHQVPASSAVYGDVITILPRGLRVIARCLRRDAK